MHTYLCICGSTRVSYTPLLQGWKLVCIGYKCNCCIACNYQLISLWLIPTYTSRPYLLCTMITKWWMLTHKINHVPILKHQSITNLLLRTACRMTQQSECYKPSIEKGLPNAEWHNNRQFTWLYNTALTHRETPLSFLSPTIIVPMVFHHISVCRCS